MEMMEGCLTLYDTRNNSRYENFRNMHKYELTRMANHGYLHTDAHENNVLINPNYPYFTQDRSHNYYGRAIIIDFGRVVNNVNKQIPVSIGTNARGQVSPLSSDLLNLLTNKSCNALPVILCLLAT